MGKGEVGIANPMVEGLGEARLTFRKKEHKERWTNAGGMTAPFAARAILWVHIGCVRS